MQRLQENARSKQRTWSCIESQLTHTHQQEHNAPAALPEAPPPTRARATPSAHTTIAIAKSPRILARCCEANGAVRKGVQLKDLQLCLLLILVPSTIIINHHHHHQPSCPEFAKQTCGWRHPVGSPRRSASGSRRCAGSCAHTHRGRQGGTGKGPASPEPPAYSTSRHRVDSTRPLRTAATNLRSLRQAGEEWRFEQAGRDGVDTDAMAGQLARDGERHAYHSALGCRVRGLADLPVVCGDAARA